MGARACPVGVDTSQTEFNAAEKTGGEKTHTLTTAEMPKHLHNIYNYHTSGGTNVPNTVEQKPAQGWRGGIQTDEQGGDQPHNNLQPYITCYMWKRTA